MRWLLNARNASVAMDGGQIVEPGGSFDLVVDLPFADVRPGLINAHEHLHRNHYGRLGHPPYANACDWARDIQARFREHIADRQAEPRRSALLAGAWKNLFAGVTTVVHHDPWEADFDRDFPMRVARVGTADSVGMGSDLRAIDRARAYCIHVAEGTDRDAAAEIGVLNSLGLVTSRLLAVHAVAVDERGIERLNEAGSAVVWCPSSNMFLLGQTAPGALLRSGVDVLLGSDSLLTGAGNLLDELRFARARSELADETLEDAVGATAARRLNLPGPSLRAGAGADLVVLTKPLLEASADDVVLVVVGGVPRVATSEVAERLNGFGALGNKMIVGGCSRWTNAHPAKAFRGNGE